MAIGYKHGIYGEYMPTTEKISEAVGTIPVYFGVAPIQRIANSEKASNKAIVIGSIAEAEAKLGYSDNDDFDKYTLSGAVYAHFKNSVKAIGPIVCISVLDTSVHKSEQVTLTETPVNNIITLPETAIVDTIVVSGKTEGVDYYAERNANGTINIRFIEESGEVNIEYYNINLSSLNAETIIGQNLNGKRKGIYCIDDVYNKLNIIPNLLVAPKFSKDKGVRAKLIEKSKEISGMWDATVVTDLDSTTANISNVISKKETDKLENIDEELCYPCVKMGDKKIFGSIARAVAIQIKDSEGDGVPYQSASNVEIGITGLLLEDGTECEMNFVEANRLNEVGICTFLYFGGRYVTWGSHSSLYKYGKTENPSEIFSINRRMDLYLNNNFKYRRAKTVDKPMKRNDIQSIVEAEQLRLNALIAEGKLLYGEIEFRANDNPKSDVINGDFRFHTMVTAPITAKSLTQSVEYTSNGVDLLVGGKENA